MSMRILSNGNRIAFEETPYADYRVEWDKDGLLISESITIKTPENVPKLSPAVLLKKERMDICYACQVLDCPAKKQAPCWMARPEACCPNDPPKWYPKPISHNG